MSSNPVPPETHSSPSEVTTSKPPYDNRMHDSSEDEEALHPYHASEPKGLHLVVDFTWSKFRNIINEKTADGRVQPLYIQHFRATKPQLKFGRADPSDATKEVDANFATGVINSVAIDGESTINGRSIHIKPLKRWRTQYNYLSHAIRSSTSAPVPVNWIAKCTLKVWDFVCINAQTQEPIAKFSVNFWAVKEVGNLYFEKSREALGQELLDEVVVTGVTILYIMMTRINNPLNLVGAVFAKTGKAEDQEEQGSADGVVKTV
ncbi:hypothetical protein ACN47E_007465 [Coniothyrium glycines]